MTPTEKAKQLVDKMYHFKTYNDKESHVAAIEHAKQCALMCCSEVLGYMGADRGAEFWQQVKQEIEKL